MKQTCTFGGKECFETPQDAHAAVDRVKRTGPRRADRLQHYRCEHCQKFHMGNRPDTKRDRKRFHVHHGRHEKQKARFR